MSFTVTSEDLKTLLQSVPELSGWSDLVNVFDRAGGAPHPDWQIPIIACQAAGGKSEDALPVAAAVACLQISIMLVDDLLDEDPRGLHARTGPGPAANIALAFQAASSELVLNSSMTAEQKTAAASILDHAALATAYGQHLDDQSLPGEENYWNVVSAKSTPFYGSCYALGSVAAGADPPTIDGLSEFGVLIGEIIQLQDDLEDALSSPANPDWLRQGNNLLIIYALNAQHDSQADFKKLLPDIAEGDLDALRKAQVILVRCGAVSYTVYHLIHRYQNTWKLIDSLSLFDPSPITEILNDFGASLAVLLSKGGVEIDLDAILNEELPLRSLAGEST